MERDQSSESQENHPNGAHKLSVQRVISRTHAVITLFSLPEGSRERGKLSMNTTRAVRLF